LINKFLLIFYDMEKLAYGLSFLTVLNI